jgi:Tol biopolymer transport system component
MDANGDNVNLLAGNTPSLETYPNWSPDGSKILFTSARDGNWELYVMDTDGTNLQRLTHNQVIDVEGKWSPDGNKILFTSGEDFDNYEIYQMDADGSNVIRLTNNSVPEMCAEWSPDGSLISFVSSGNGEDIFLMDSDGNNKRPLVTRALHDFDPSWSPDGKYIAFQTAYDNNNDEIAVVEIATGEITRLTTTLGWDSTPCWKADSVNSFFPGVIAFSNTPPDDNNEIYIINADGTGLQRLTNRPGRDAGPSWSPDATEIAFYTHYDNLNTWSIFKMNADGSDIVRLTNTAGVFDSSPHWSPDGSLIIYSREYPPIFNAEIWKMNADGTNIHRIVEDGLGGEWSPDGSQIVYASQQDGDFEIYLMSDDGSGLLKLTDNDADDLWPSWSPDGNWLVFQSDRDGNVETYKMKKDGTVQTRLTNSPGIDAGPDWSPDGEYIAFVSGRDGNFEIYIMNADGSDQSRLTSNLAVHNIQPDWKPNISTGIETVDSGGEVLKGFRLFQNYPNPFNPRTTISFQIPSQSYVSLKIFDVLGNEVAVLENKERPEGVYEVEYEASGLTSGIYFYQLITGRFAETKKMILLK